MVGPYCSQCGEKRLTPKDYSLPHLAEETLGVFTHLDSKFLRTLKALVTKPGELSRAYFHGGRSRYTKPLTLFVIINVIFFVVQPHTGFWHQKHATYMTDRNYAAVVDARLATTREPVQSYAARFDANLQNQKKSLLIISVPLLALVMSLLFIGTRHTYVEHLLFSVQVYAFDLLCMLTLALLVVAPLRMVARTLGSGGARLRSVLDGELAIVLLSILWLTIYMYHGLRRAYDASRIRAGLVAFVLALTAMYLTGIYYRTLFWATFWTT